MAAIIVTSPFNGVSSTIRAMPQAHIPRTANLTYLKRRSCCSLRGPTGRPWLTRTIPIFLSVLFVMVVSDHTATSAENLEPLPSRGSYTKDSPYSASTDEVFKKLRIQSGVVRRLCKEHSYYISECGSQLRRIEDMKVPFDSFLVFLSICSPRMHVCTT